MPDWVITLFVAISGLLYLFSKIQRERKGLPSTEARVKIPLSWAIIGFVLLFIFTLGNMLFFHLHGFPVPGAFWFALVVVSAAILVSGIVLIKRKGPEYIPPAGRKAGTRLVAVVGALVVVMPVLGFSIRALQRKFGF
jgi:ABC-type iron transport system FetAB permease component